MYAFLGNKEHFCFIVSSSQSNRFVLETKKDVLVLLSDTLLCCIHCTKHGWLRCRCNFTYMYLMHKMSSVLKVTGKVIL